MIQSELENEAVTQLKKFGFIMADRSNIYYHAVYSAFFLDILAKKKGGNAMKDEVIDEIMAEVENQRKPDRG